MNAAYHEALPVWFRDCALPQQLFPSYSGCESVVCSAPSRRKAPRSKIPGFVKSRGSVVNDLKLFRNELRAEILVKTDFIFRIKTLEL